MGDLELPRGAANYGDIPSGLYYNHTAVIHVDTEICPALFRETVTQSFTVLVAASVTSNQTSLQSTFMYLAVSCLSSLSHPPLSRHTFKINRHCLYVYDAEQQKNVCI